MSVRRVLVPAVLVAILGGWVLWGGGAPTPAEAVCPSTINYGETVACDISAVGEEDTFAFSGTDGEKLTVRMTAVANQNLLRPDVEVRRPDGSVPAGCSGWTYYHQVDVLCSLDVSGTWSVVVSDNDSNTAEPYELHVQRLVNPVGATATSYGGAHAAILTPGDLHAYTFSGVAGHVIRVRWREASGFYPNYDIRIVSPSGVNCAQANPCTLDATGIWTVLVGDDYQGYGSGGYEIRVVRELAAPPYDPLKRILDTSYPAVPTGDFAFEVTDLSIPGRGLPLEFTRYYHSSSGRVGALGRSWSHTYDMYLDDQATRVLVYYPQGFTREFVWNGSAYNAATGVWDKLVKNGDGTYALTTKGQLKYGFDATGKLTTIADKNGNATTLHYDVYGSDALLWLEDSSGRTLNFSYNSDLRIIQVAAPLGRTVSFSYIWDGYGGALTTATDVLGGTTTYTYSDHRIQTVTDALGQVQVTNGYDVHGRLAERRNALNETTCYYFHISSANPQYQTPACPGATVGPWNSELVIVDPEGHETWIDGDAEYRYAAETDATGGYWFRTYDDDNNVLTLTDPHGEITTFTYDARGNQLTSKDPRNETWTYTYNSFDQVLTAKDPLNWATTNAYDAKGNLTSITDAAGNQTVFTVNALGQVAKVTGARLNATDYTYDTYGNQTTVTDALSNTWTSVYDLGGRVTSVTDPLSRVTSYTYNDANQVLTETNPLGQVTTFDYDLKGRNTWVRDAELNSTTFGYDNADRLSSVTDALSQATTYAYDEVGNQTSVTNARGKVTSYTYDGMGRRLTVTDPLSRTTSYVYDRAGQLTSRTDARGLVSEYVYDEAGRVTAIDYKTGGAVVDEVDYLYDELGRRTSMTDSTGTTVWSYNTIGQVTQVTHPGPKVFAYVYDAVGNTTQIQYPDLKTVDYTYDVLNRLEGVQDWALNSTSYAWGNSGTLTSTTLPNGVVASYAYDNADRLLSVTNTKGVETLSSFTYTLDNVGNRTQMVDGTGTATYALDDLYRLTSVTYPGPDTDTYSYDPLGNRLTKNADPYTYDDADQMLTAVGASSAQPFSSTLPVVEGDQWSYFKGTAEPPATWKDVGFDDSGWLQGPSGFGYADGDDATVLSDMSGSYLTVYARREFTVSDASLVTELTLSVDFDDGFVAYLNGVEVDRRNVSSTAYNSTATAFREAGTPVVIAVDPGLLNAGANVLAVQGHNGSLDSSDFSLIPELSVREVGLELHDDATHWDEISSAGTTFSVTNGATMLVVVVGTEEIGAGPKALDGLSSSIDGAFDGIAVQATSGTTNENTVAIGYLLNPSVGSHNISFDWGGAAPDDVTATAFTLTGTVDAIPVGTTGTDLTMSSGVLSIGSLDVTAYDYGVFAGVSGGANGNNLWAPDAGWTEFTDKGDNSSSHFVQARSYAGPGTDSVDATYSGGTNRQAGIAVIFKGAQPSGGGPVSYGYDNNGNTVSRGSDVFAWDHRNRMTTSVVGGVPATYTYNGDGVRMSQTVGGVVTNYNVDVLAPLPVMMQDGTYSYVYGLDLISAVDGSGSEIYYTYDGLGSVANLTDATGAVTDSYTYDVFGEIRTSSGSTSNDWLFTGEQEDESGLYFLRARYYDPVTGRFIGRDPLEFAQRYAYAGNNPVAFTDPAGLEYEGAGGGVGIGGFVGGGASVCWTCVVKPVVSGTIGGVLGGLINWASDGDEESPLSDEVREKIDGVLGHVERTGNPPDGHKGGRVWENDGRGGSEVLPTHDADGKPITYQEYDVNPTHRRLPRDRERIVIGSDGAAYYTDEHYETFERVRGPQ